MAVLLVSIFTFWQSVAFAAEFVATVESTQLTFGESIQLKLELHDAKATASLDISALAKEFTIYQQQQFSTYSNVNGVVKAENGWQVTLLPKHAGELIIPEITISTDKGILSTQPINLKITNAKAGSLGDKNNAGISLMGIVNKHKAYVNEPIIYTLKIISYKPIANVVLDDIKSSDAIIEKIGEPKQYDQNHGGMRAHIIEIRYAITGLRAGKIKIPPTTMTGELQVQNQQSRNQRYGMFNNIIFDNAFELKPFNLQTDEVSLEILPAVGKTSAWLPLNSLSITQTWDIPADIKVGETITRKIKMVGNGAFAKQLPSTKDQQPSTKVKVYANKPNFTDRFDESSNTVVGIKEEEFSIVPQADGTLHVPAIELKWWDLKAKKWVSSTLPAKEINVAAQRSASGANVTLDFSNSQEPQTVAEEKPATTGKATAWYIVVGIIAGVLISIAGLLAGMLIWKKLVRRSSTKANKNLTSAPLQDSDIANVTDLRNHILRYAQKHWHIAEHIVLNRLGDALTSKNYIYSLPLYLELTKAINAALYADKQADLTKICKQWEEFKHSVAKSRHNHNTNAVQNEYSDLNPT